MKQTSSHDDPWFIGIDVQLQRGLAYAVMMPDGRVMTNGWFDGDDASDVIERLAGQFPGARLGIDAPRQPLPSLREHYWSAAGWRKRRAADRGFGRHCEIVIAACGLARPQWTPTVDAAPEWMRLGFALFAESKRMGVEAEEVFPSAAYRMLDKDTQARVEVPLSSFANGPKDMLDATVAALVLREYVQGRGSAVGDGDGLGRILLPRPVEHPSYAMVSAWPGA